MAPRMLRSSTARSAARSISPRAARDRASLSSGGRSRLPTWSARNGGLAAMLIVPSASWGAGSTRRVLPGQSVGGAARIGTGREHAGLGIAPRYHRTDAARAGLRHLVAERSKLGASPLGNARLDVQLARSIHARVERVDERLGREARRLDRLLRVHPEDEE